jgi:hypothetical protein
MKKYADAFRRENICGRSLFLLTEEELRDSLSVDSLGDRKCIMFEIGRLSQWSGWLWRGEVDGEAGQKHTIELLLSLSPSRMYALCSVRDTPTSSSSVDYLTLPQPLTVRWVFTQESEAPEGAKPHRPDRFSTDATYSRDQNRSIVRLPTRIVDADVQIL